MLNAHSIRLCFASSGSQIPILVAATDRRSADTTVCYISDGTGDGKSIATHWNVVDYVVLAAGYFIY